MPASSNTIWWIVSSDYELGGAPLKLLVSPRARRRSLRVDPCSRAVTLTVPRRFSRRRALAWAAGHGAWVERALPAIPDTVPLRPGSVVPLRGLPHRVHWGPALTRRVRPPQRRV